MNANKTEYSRDKNPTLKLDVHYRIDKNYCEISEEGFPKVGESFVLAKDDGKIVFLVHRKDRDGWIHNYVRYFSDIWEVGAFLNYVQYSIDLGFGRDRIMEHESEIKRLKADYGLD